MRDLRNPKVSEGFLTEHYEKEIGIRMDWVFKHKEMVQSTIVFRGEPKNYTRTGIHYAQTISELGTIKGDHIMTAHRRTKVTTPRPSGLAFNIIRTEEQVTRPDDKTTKVKDYAQALSELATIKRDHRAHRRMIASVDYSGPTVNNITNGDQVMRPIDKSTKELIAIGSKEYFKRRNQMSPEDKYYYPETTSWAYGWKLQDSSIKTHGPVYPRVCHVTCKVGMQPDPCYYGNPGQQTTGRRFIFL